MIFSLLLLHLLLLPLPVPQALAGAAAGGAGPPASFDVYDFGAKGDGETLDTPSIQAAVDACAEKGGGTVVLARGTFLSGTLRLRSRVSLFIDAGAVLLGSTDLEDYPSLKPAFRSFTDTYTERSLLYAEQAEGIAILGRGVIDGQGGAFRGPYKKRPYLVRVIACRNVRVEGVTLRNAPMWVQHYLACEDVSIHGITVQSKVNGNNDGIDIDGCSRVRISDCDIDSGDDAIVLKSTSNRPCRNVTITNCTLTTFCNAVKLGTESNGGFRNVVVSNCAVYDTRLAGVALELVDGGVFENVTVSGLVMENVGCALFIRLGNRARPFTEGMEKPGMGSMENILVSGIQARGVGKTGCSITGLPGRPVRNVTLRDIRISFQGEGTAEDAARAVPERRDSYPEFSMFGTLPAYGFYVRHVENLSFRGMDLSLEKADARPALVLEDVKGFELTEFRAAPSGSVELVRFKDVSRAFLHGCRAYAPARTFLSVRGKASRGILLSGNDFRGLERVFVLSGDAAADVVELR